MKRGLWNNFITSATISLANSIGGVLGRPPVAESGARWTPDDARI